VRTPYKTVDEISQSHEGTFWLELYLEKCYQAKILENIMVHLWRANY